MTKGHKDERPRTTHRDYSIYLGDNDEEWKCNELGLSAPKLSTLKGQIDRAIKRMNNERGVPCLFLQDYGEDLAIAALVIGIKERTRLEHTSNGNKDIRRVYVSWMGRRRGSERATLSERQEITEFVPDTPEVREMLVEADRMQSAIDQATKKRRDFITTIPRVTEEMFAGLRPDADDDD